MMLCLRWRLLTQVFRFPAVEHQDRPIAVTQVSLGPLAAGLTELTAASTAIDG